MPSVPVRRILSPQLSRRLLAPRPDSATAQACRQSADKKFSGFRFSLFSLTRFSNKNAGPSAFQLLVVSMLERLVKHVFFFQAVTSPLDPSVV